MRKMNNRFSYENLLELGDNSSLDLGQGYQISIKGITKDARPITLGFVSIEQKFVDQETQARSYKIIYVSEGNLQTLIVQAADLASNKIGNLAQYDVPINHNKKADIANALYLIGQRLESQYVGSKLGFNHVNEKLVFYGMNEPELLSSKLTDLFSIETRGTLNEEIEIIHLFKEAASQLVYLIGLSGIVGYLQNTLLKKELMPIIVHLFGDSSTAKTTSVMAALSAFGNPDQRAKNSLLQTYTSTDNALVKKASCLQGFPMGIDDSGASREQDKLKLILRIGNGRDADRLSNSSYSVKSGAGFFCPILSNGEKSLQKELTNSSGANLRLTELDNLKYACDKENAEQIKRAALTNFGHVGPGLAKRLLDMGESLPGYLEGTYKESYEGLKEKFPADDKKLDRFISQVTVIYQTGLIFNKAFNQNFQLEEIKNLLIKNIEKVNEVLDYSKFALDRLEDWVQSNKNRFGIGGITRTQKGHVLGRIDLKTNTDKSLVWMKKSELEKAFTELHLADLSVVMNDFKEKDLLVYDQGRLQKKYQGDWYYVIKMNL